MKGTTVEVGLGEGIGWDLGDGTGGDDDDRELVSSSTQNEGEDPGGASQEVTCVYFGTLGLSSRP